MNDMAISIQARINDQLMLFPEFRPLTAGGKAITAEARSFYALSDTGAFGKAVANDGIVSESEIATRFGSRADWDYAETEFWNGISRRFGLRSTATSSTTLQAGAAVSALPPALSQYVGLSPVGGRLVYTHQFYALPSASRAHVLLELKTYLLGNQSAEDLINSAQGQYENLLQEAKTKSEQLTGSPKQYWQATFAWLTGDVDQAEALWRALLSNKKIDQLEPVVAQQISHHLNKIHRMRTQMVAQELIRLDQYTDNALRQKLEDRWAIWSWIETSFDYDIDAEEKGDYARRAQFRSQLMTNFAEGRATTLKEALEIAKAQDLSGYEAWRRWSDQIHEWAYNSSAIEDLSTSETDEFYVKTSSLLDFETQITPTNYHEMVAQMALQRANFLRIQGDSENAAQILKGILAKEFSIWQTRIPSWELKDLNIKYDDLRYVAEIREHYTQSRDYFVDVLHQMGAEVSDDVVEALISSAVNAHIALEKDREQDLLASRYWEEKDFKGDPLKSRAFNVYVDMLDPMNDSFNLSDNNKNRLMRQVTVNAVLLLFTGGIGTLVREAGSRALTALAIRKLGEESAKRLMVRTAIYIPSAVAGGTAMHTAQSVLLTPFYGKGAWNHYVKGSLLSSLLFGGLDAGKWISDEFNFMLTIFLLGDRLITKTSLGQFRATLTGRALNGLSETSLQATVLTGLSQIELLAEGSPAEEGVLEQWGQTLLMVAELKLLGKGIRSYLETRLPDPLRPQQSFNYHTPEFKPFDSRLRGITNDGRQVLRLLQNHNCTAEQRRNIEQILKQLPEAVQTKILNLFDQIWQEAQLKAKARGRASAIEVLIDILKETKALCEMARKQGISLKEVIHFHETHPVSSFSKGPTKEVSIEGETFLFPAAVLAKMKLWARTRGWPLRLETSGDFIVRRIGDHRWEAIDFHPTAAIPETLAANPISTKFSQGKEVPAYYFSGRDVIYFKTALMLTGLTEPGQLVIPIPEGTARLSFHSHPMATKETAWVIDSPSDGARGTDYPYWTYKSSFPFDGDGNLNIRAMYSPYSDTLNIFTRKPTDVYTSSRGDTVNVRVKVSE